jgi:hypothetical protein
MKGNDVVSVEIMDTYLQDMEDVNRLREFLDVVEKKMYLAKDGE